MAGKGKRNERKTGKDRVKNWWKQGRTFRWRLTALRRDDFFQNICFQFWRIGAPSAICDFQAPVPRALVSNEKRKGVDDERNDEEGQRKRRREKGRWEWKERKKGARKRERKARKIDGGGMYPRIPFSVSFFSASAPARQRSFRNSQPGIHRTN